MHHWYALHTKPRKEHQVHNHLVAQGIEAYLPVIVRPYSRGRATWEQPFFSRYLFGRLDLAQTPLSAVNWLPGMSRVVSFGGQPAVVPDPVIGWLRGHLAGMETVDYHTGLPLRRDDRVRVTEGPLRGLEGIFDQRLSGDERARILVELLGRLTACELPLEWVMRV